MSKSSFVILIFVGVLFATIQASSPSDYFSDADTGVLSNLLSTSKQTDGSFGSGLADTYYAISTAQFLGLKQPQDTCNYVASYLASADVEELYYAAAISAALNCNKKIAKNNANLQNGLEAENVEDIYFSLKALALANADGKDAVDVAEAQEQILQTLEKLKEDDGSVKNAQGDQRGTFYHGGLALQIYGFLELNDEQNEAVNEQVSNLFTLEEEEDVLVFTETNSLNNLCATASVWEGVTRIADSLDEEITNEQVTKLANYFIGQKRVNSLRDAYCLVNGLRLINENPFSVPLVLTLSKGSLMSSASKRADLTVKVTDIFGKHTTDDLRVYLRKAYPEHNEKKILLGDQFAPVDKADANKVSYSLNFMAAKPEPGYYNLEFSVSLSNPNNSKYSNIDSVVRKLKVISEIAVSDVSVKIADADDETQFGSHVININYPQSSKDNSTVNILQNLIISFKLRNVYLNRPVSVHQSFVLFAHQDGDLESIFVVPRSGKDNSLTIKLKEVVEAFKGKSGVYDLYLVIGDPFIENPIFWKFVSVNLNFGKKYSASSGAENLLVSKDKKIVRHTLNNIEHQFRPAEKRPPVGVSYAFAATAVALPLLVFIICLGNIGVNFKNFPSTGLDGIFALGFHGFFGAILGLYVVFWLQLNMVQTLVYLLLLAVPTILLGLKTLQAVHKARSVQKKQQ